MRRRIEITTIERERVVRLTGGAFCPLCRQPSEWLTTAQAAALAKVSRDSIRRWLARSLAHGIKTCSGQYRVCRNSLFAPAGR